MGQKTHPIGFRLGFNKEWNSLWYAKKGNYAEKLHEDFKIKNFIKKNYEKAAIARVVVKRRVEDKVEIIVYTARPGAIIGRQGKELQRIKNSIMKLIGEKDISITVTELKKPEAVAQLSAEDIALKLEKRTAFRRAMKYAVDRAMKSGGVQGIKVMVSGRLGGAEIARSEWYLMGKVPLQTLKADIDYGFAEAKTTYGVIGVKVWIYKGIKEKEKSVGFQLKEEV